MQSKTGQELSIFERERLTAILNEPDRTPGEDIVVNQQGRPGLTFHGLRKSLGKRAADDGFSELDIAAALGHTIQALAHILSRLHVRAARAA